MKKLFCFSFLLIIFNLAAIAQQDPQFSFYKLAQLTNNPGYAGTSRAISGLILNRTQWSGLEGAPKTKLFSAESSTELWGIKSGIGLNVIRDELGFEKTTLVNLNYAYLVETGWGNLGIGTSLGIFNKAIDGTWDAPSRGDYVVSDPYLPDENVSQVAFDLGFGLYLKSPDYFAGISVTHLNQAEISFSDDAYTFYTRHYYFTGGYTIQMSNPLFTVQPSVLYRTDLAASQTDLNVDVTYNERFTGGIGYRLNEGLIIGLSVELQSGLKAGYAYDLTTSALGADSSGSHELFLSYVFAIRKGKNKKYKSVRYL
ncbi:type IX secretion system membrane protein PorP/SprF [Mangrovibacterium marinum]|uniref:Type IX secretion system PorP/SprF family membrane protein n=1 Tax=Mangrovibacterium marinum TaxID=1639118 RepID=A0A2T5C0Z3_9BACT|nr:type IX secretion system membrane protein PorP/SprF [Mangrovibacterium marinum]PTN08282.1 type IX secretion system PorP/SprF family membrane protein [Mangrovibacterium marinum]